MQRPQLEQQRERQPAAAARAGARPSQRALPGRAGWARGSVTAGLPVPAGHRAPGSPRCPAGASTPERLRERRRRPRAVRGECGSPETAVRRGRAEGARPRAAPRHPPRPPPPAGGQRRAGRGPAGAGGSGRPCPLPPLRSLRPFSPRSSLRGSSAEAARRGPADFCGGEEEEAAAARSPGARGTRCGGGGCWGSP